MGAKLPSAAYKSCCGGSHDHRSHAVEEMDDVDVDIDDDADVEGTEPEHDELDDDIVESDIEFEAETVEPDNDPPQKVLSLHTQVVNKMMKLVALTVLAELLLLLVIFDLILHRWGIHRLR